MAVERRLGQQRWISQGEAEVEEAKVRGAGDEGGAIFKRGGANGNAQAEGTNGEQRPPSHATRHQHHAQLGSAPPLSSSSSSSSLVTLSRSNP